jgi:DNA-binding beta-propeller fold protein YncE
LAHVDLSTGKTVALAPTIPKFMGIAFSPQGKLYGVNTYVGGGVGTFCSIDPKTGFATGIGPDGGVGDIMDLAFHADGTLYGLDHHSDLYRVNSRTGIRTLVTHLSDLSAPMGLVITPDGSFYASDYVTNSPIVRMDVATGRTVVVLRTGVDFVHGLDLSVPRLSAALINGQLQISWPQAADGYVLQTADTLDDPAHWTDGSEKPSAAHGRLNLTPHMHGPARFFRLSRP